MSPDDLKRVVVVGTSCSGKTTFARSLAQKLGVTHIELDAIHWRPNWTPAPLDEFRADVSKAVEPETWVLDGNYGKARDIVWPRATSIIWLNYPIHTVIRRALTRTLRRAFTREELWAGNRESFRISFLSRDSILLWIAQTYHRRRRQYPRLFEAPENSHLKITELNSQAQADDFLYKFGKKYPGTDEVQ